MGLAKLVVVMCDAMGCDAYLDTTTDDYDQAVRDAADKGWTSSEDGDHDFCPNHGGA